MPVSKSPLVRTWLTQTADGDGVAETVEAPGADDVATEAIDMSVDDSEGRLDDAVV